MPGWAGAAFAPEAGHGNPHLRDQRSDSGPNLREVCAQLREQCAQLWRVRSHRRTLSLLVQRVQVLLHLLHLDTTRLTLRNAGM